MLVCLNGTPELQALRTPSGCGWPFSSITLKTQHASDMLLHAGTSKLIGINPSHMMGWQE